MRQNVANRRLRRTTSVPVRHPGQGTTVVRLSSATSAARQLAYGLPGSVPWALGWLVITSRSVDSTLGFALESCPPCSRHRRAVPLYALRVGAAQPEPRGACRCRKMARHCCWTRCCTCSRVSVNAVDVDEGGDGEMIPVKTRSAPLAVRRK